MAVRSSAILARTPGWGLVALLAILFVLAAWFIHSNVLPYLTYTPAAYGPFWPRRFGLISHVSGGLLAVTVGLVQIWLGLTGRTGSLHRTLGRVYVLCIAVGSVGAFYLALTIGANHFVYSAGLFGLAFAWVLTTVMAVVAVRRRSFDQHREWMLRSYTVTFAFVNFRLFENMILHWNLASPDDADAFMAFACWAFPLLLAEPLIQLQRMSRT